jgi:uncharacterized membrane protein YdjX (TVP38/TMEM64 family)
MTMNSNAPKTGTLARLVPLAALLVAAVVAWYLFGDSVSFEALAANRAWLLTERDAHYLLTSLVFVAIYTLAVATSLPGALILTLTGGFLFGVFPGVLYNVSGATLGATLVFVAVHFGFGRDLAAKMAAGGGSVASLQAALRDNEWSVLLTMRLIPVIPFFIANLIPAFVGVRLRTFVVTTALGILPASLIYTSIGAGLGEVFARGEVPQFSILLQPRFVLPLVGLAGLAMLPMLVKIYRKSRG